MRIKQYVGWCLLLASAALVEPAWAETASQDCEADSACLALYERAKVQSANGKLLEAVRLYKLAFEVQADPRILYNIARVLHKQGDNQAAANFYQRFLDSPLQDEEQKMKARAFLRELPPSSVKSAESGDAKPSSSTVGTGLVGASTPAPVNRRWWTPDSEDTPVAAAPQLVSPVVAVEKERATPVYKKWWFWTAVGGGAALLAAGAAVGITVGMSRSSDPVSDGLFIYRPTL